MTKPVPRSLEDRTLLTTVSIADLTVQRGAAGPAVATGTISPGTATDGYRIDGVAGEMLRFHDDSTSSTVGTWALYGPDNRPVSGASAAFGTDFTASLPTDGYYDLYLEGADTTGPITYKVEVTDITDPATAATGLNSPQSGSLLIGGSTNYTFTAPAGEKIYFDDQGSPGSGGLTYTLTDPTNQTVFSTPYNYDYGL